MRNLMHLYLYDFSEMDGADVNARGLFEDEYLDRYWIEPGRHPFLVRVDGQLAGFALVRVGSHYLADDDPRTSATRCIAEFCVLRKYRRRGIGERVAVMLFDLFPGRWEVAEIAQNTNAQAFWRKVIDRYVQGQYEEIVIDHNGERRPVQVFDNTRRDRSIQPIERKT
jgi:predicted acetyltransferase